jgi:hypothetical protein
MKRPAPAPRRPARQRRGPATLFPSWPGRSRRAWRPSPVGAAPRPPDGPTTPAPPGAQLAARQPTPRRTSDGPPRGSAGPLWAIGETFGVSFQTVSNWLHGDPQRWRELVSLQAEVARSAPPRRLRGAASRALRPGQGHSCCTSRACSGPPEHAPGAVPLAGGDVGEPGPGRGGGLGPSAPRRRRGLPVVVATRSAASPALMVDAAER